MTKIEYIITKQVEDYLLSIGFGKYNSKSQSMKCAEFYRSKLSNSKDVFKDCCDYAGSLAHTLEPNVKYKQPKSKSKPRKKKPQEAFNF